MDRLYYEINIKFPQDGFSYGRTFYVDAMVDFGIIWKDYRASEDKTMDVEIRVWKRRPEADSDEFASIVRKGGNWSVNREENEATENYSVLLGCELDRVVGLTADDFIDSWEN